MQLSTSSTEAYNRNISRNTLKLEASEVEACFNNSRRLHSCPQYILLIGNVARLTDTIQ